MLKLSYLSIENHRQS